jgi:hypothetical protein
MACRRRPSPSCWAATLAMVRRGVHRYNPHGTSGLGDRPRAGRPPLGSPRLHQRILRLLDQPKAWTIGRLWQRLGRPALSQRTLRRRVRQVACWRRPRLVAKGDPDREQVLADLRHAIAGLPRGGGAGRGRDLPQPAALGAGHLDHPRHLPTGDDAGHQPAADDLRRRRPAHGSLLLPGGPQGGQRRLPWPTCLARSRSQG